jgi:hypothetical protein
MGIRSAVAFIESSFVDVPMVIGWLRPVLLVPVAALSGLSAPELEAILAHELAHIRRHDYLVNFLQCVVEILMFYHPATWWITTVMRREREHCCDDMAVAASGDRFTYVRALAALEGLRSPAFSLSQAANGGKLTARVRHVLNPQEASMNVVPILVFPAVLLVIAPICLTRALDRPTRATTARTTTSPQPARAAPDGPDTIRPSDAPTQLPTSAGTGADGGEKPAVAPVTPSVPDSPPSERSRQEQERMIAGLIKELKDQKRHPVGMINEMEAEKTFRTGMYYKRVGKVAASDFFFDKTFRRWPDSSWAAKADRERHEVNRRIIDMVN